MDFIKIIVLLASSLFSLITTDDFEEKPIVNLASGKVQGEKMIGERGNKFHSFRGIPYAEPPVGNLRFKPPVPKKPWKGVVIANKDGPCCPQFAGKAYAGNEDCLFINVYTPKLPNETNKKMDVIYYIHGGGYLFENSFMYGPKRFLLDDVVVVVANYRVATMGFLSTNDSAARGNYGLLDQTEGLKWVRDNIHHFSGDPNKVTIMGESAGGASVTYQMLTPLSEGLFHRAISMSGSALNPWALQKDPVYWTHRLAKRLNCPTDTSEKLVECLRQKSAEEITTNGAVFVEGLWYYVTAPVLDNHFIHDTPLNIIRQAKLHKNVQLLMGTTEDEGKCWYSGRKNSPKDFTDEEIDNVLKQTVSVLPNVDDKIHLIKEKYFSNLTSYKESVVMKPLGKAITDGMFQKNIFQFVKESVNSGRKVYFFRYDYQIPKLNHHGVCHTDDLYVIWDRTGFELSLDPQSQKMSDKVQKTILNFVKHGDPIPSDNEDEDCKWPACEKNKLNFFHYNLKCSLNVYDPKEDPLYDFWVNKISKA